MQNDVGYQDPAYVDETHEPETGPEKRSGGINIPTVLASAGVAAVISAIIVTIGVVGLMVGDRNDSANAAQPTVVNLGSAQTPQQQQGLVGPAANQPPAAAPGEPAPAVAPAPAATENVPESGGIVGAGPDAVAPAPAPAPAPGTSAAPTQQAVAAPTALTPGQLNTKVKTVMNSRGNRAARAAELQGGERALRQLDAVAQAITTYGNVGLSYQMVGPVQVSGTKMTAPLQISVVGRGSQNRAMTWVWSGDKWKLSNSSVCLIASFVLLPCSL
ncbi:UNVERIFIED_ORG: hypothetical protein L601_003100000360 [Gordonia westfalica J30]